MSVGAGWPVFLTLAAAVIGLLLAASLSRGAQSVSATRPAQYRPIVFEQVEQLGGSLNSIVVSGAHAYSVIGARVVTIDFSDLTEPVVMHRTAPSFTRVLTVHRGHLYAVGEGDRLVTLDITEPASPVEAGRIELDGVGSARDMMRLRGDLFVLPAAGVTVLDLSLPAQPAISARFAGVNGQNLATSAGRYVHTTHYEWENWATGEVSLVIVDFGDLTTPHELGRVVVDSPGPGAELERISDLASFGEHVLVILAVASTGRPPGFRVFDAHDPTSPRLVAGLPIGGAHELVVRETSAFVASGSNRLHEVDLANPIDPRLVGTRDVPSGAGLALESGRLFVANTSAGLHVVDPSDPDGSRVAGWFGQPGAITDIAVSGDLVVAVDVRERMWMIDGSDRTRLRVTGWYDIEGEGDAYVDVSGNYAFAVRGEHGLQVIDISDPAAPAGLARVAIPGSARFVGVSNDTAVVVSYPPTLSLIDVSDPRRPRAGGTMPLPDQATGLAMLDGFALVTTWDGKLLVVANDDADTPRSVRRIPIRTGGRLADVSVHERWAYVAGTDGWPAPGLWLNVYDLELPAEPRHVAALKLVSMARHMQPIDGYVLMSMPSHELTIVNVSDPTAPWIEATLDPDEFGGVGIFGLGPFGVLGEHIVASAWDRGLAVYRFEASVGPTPTSTAVPTVTPTSMPYVGSSILYLPLVACASPSNQ